MLFSHVPIFLEFFGIFIAKMLKTGKIFKWLIYSTLIKVFTTIQSTFFNTINLAQTHSNLWYNFVILQSQLWRQWALVNSLLWVLKRNWSGPLYWYLEWLFIRSLWVTSLKSYWLTINLKLMVILRGYHNGFHSFKSITIQCLYRKT